MPDYRKVVESWIGRKTARGLTREESYRSVVGDIKGFYNATVEIGKERGIAMLPLLLPEGLEEEFREYLKEYGSRYEGKWYFRITWLNPYLRRILEDGGVIERVGTSSDLERNGVNLREDQGGSAVYYRANRIN